ncbi:MAG: DUF4288 domain-containing protein [Candidatus Sumerlaeia bacterium]
MKRFSAKLLFAYRCEDFEQSIRLCEERIVTFNARSPRHALQVARSKGRKARLKYKNDAGGQVYFEFIGIMDMVELFCEPDEVWYDIRRRRVPLERLIPTDDHLLNHT